MVNCASYEQLTTLLKAFWEIFVASNVNDENCPNLCRQYGTRIRIYLFSTFLAVNETFSFGRIRWKGSFSSVSFGCGASFSFVYFPQMSETFPRCRIKYYHQKVRKLPAKQRVRKCSRSQCRKKKQKKTSKNNVFLMFF